jgi:glycogen operon protein
MVSSVMEHLKKNGSKNSYVSSIADYHGLRLADVVSYNNKHNEANGEKNTDGVEQNYSWNCGVEGPTEEPRVLALRMQQMKNALSLILLGQSTPYLFMGDEMGSSQNGNNNPYNQDNEISWLNWECMNRNKELYDFTKSLLAYRKEHPFLHEKGILDGRDYLGHGYPNISLHGKEAYKVDCGENCKEFAIMFCGENKDQICKLIYIAFNMHWLNRKLALPRLKGGMEWQVWMTTSDIKELPMDERYVEIPSRTIVVLEATVALSEKDSLKHITAF